MPFVIDDVLIGLAISAATAAAEELSQDLVQGMTKTLFGNLATKEELLAAVDAIENYVHEEFDSLKNDMLYSNVLTAISQMQAYMADPSIGQQFLGFAADHIATAQTWIDIQTNDVGPDFLRLQFVPLVQFAATDIVIWSSYALMIDPRYKPELAKRITRHVTLLNQAVDQIRKKETETITAIHSRFERHYTGYNGTIVVEGGIAWYDMTKGGNQSGHVEKSANGEGRAIDDIRPSWQRDVDRINAGATKRSEVVYAPVAQFCNSMTALKARLG